MASYGQVFGPPQVSGESPLTTGHVWVGSSSIATDTAPTGTGTPVFSSTPTLVTPVLGAATATSINFGGTSLSAYVEGTWTPTITTDGTVGTPAYTTQVGSYERIGRQVTARFTIILSGWTGSPTGNVSVAGLPLTSANVANDFGHCFMSVYQVAGLAALQYGIVGRISASSTSILLFSNSSAGSGSISAAQFGTGVEVVEGIAFYHV